MIYLSRFCYIRCIFFKVVLKSITRYSDYWWTIPKLIVTLNFKKKFRKKFMFSWTTKYKYITFIRQMKFKVQTGSCLYPAKSFGISSIRNCNMIRRQWENQKVFFYLIRNKKKDHNWYDKQWATVVIFLSKESVPSYAIRLKHQLQDKF